MKNQVWLKWLPDVWVVAVLCLNVHAILPALCVLRWCLAFFIKLIRLSSAIIGIFHPYLIIIGTRVQASSISAPGESSKNLFGCSFGVTGWVSDHQKKITVLIDKVIHFNPLQYKFTKSSPSMIKMLSFLLSQF